MHGGLVKKEKRISGPILTVRKPLRRLAMKPRYYTTVTNRRCFEKTHYFGVISQFKLNMI